MHLYSPQAKTFPTIYIVSIVNSDCTDIINSDCHDITATKNLIEYEPMVRRSRRHAQAVASRWPWQSEYGYSAPVVQACIALMHGRFFGGRKLEAALWDGIEKFYVKPVVVKETEEEQALRLDQYAAELEQGKA